MKRKSVGSYLLLLPALVFLLGFTYYPFFQTVWTSFFKVNAIQHTSLFVGAGNYTKVVHDELFWKVIKNNIVFSLGTVPTSLALGLFLAVLVNRKFAMTGLYRALFFYPNILPMIAAANIWLFLYNPEIGFLHQVMKWFHTSGWNPLGDENWVMFSLIFMTVWKEAGYFMLFYLAGLQQMPKDVLEAARIEGGSWQTFWRITLPLLGPTSLFVAIIAIVNSFKMVDQVYILTGGGPNNASNLLLYYIYQVAFQFWDTNMAGTLTVILGIILAVIMCLNYFVFDKKVHYQ